MTRPDNSPLALPADKDDEPVCPKCGDAGIVRERVSLIDGPVPGTMVQQLRRCGCTPTEPWGIPAKRKGDTFESFDLSRNPTMAPAKERAEAIARGDEWAGLFHGTFGNGKTHLAIAALNAMGDGAFWKAPDLLDHIRREAYGKERGADEVIKSLANRPGLLVIDDLGVENPTDWAGETLYRILDLRCDERLPTILTTNADFTRLDGRITSRYGKGLIVCDGEDLRVTS